MEQKFYCTVIIETESNNEVSEQWIKSWLEKKLKIPVFEGGTIYPKPDIRDVVEVNPKRSMV